MIDKPSRYVLEMNGGSKKRFNLKEGDKINFIEKLDIKNLNIFNIYKVVQYQKVKTAEEKEKEKQKIKEDAKWTLEQEELLAEWAEKAACYRWLHNQAEKYYRCRNYAFTIPVIIFQH